jgi:hypothetical protein
MRTLEDGSNYDGESDLNGKMAGWGILTRTDGVVYEGFFLDGQFHGEGTLRFTNGTSYKAHWERGAEVPGSGALQWVDGLIFNPQQGVGEGGAPAAAAPAAAPQPRTPGAEWLYLTKDRRLWGEHVAGVRAATSPQKRTSEAQTNADGGGGAA